MARISAASIERFRRERLAENNPFWKGDKVGYDGLHHWIRRRIIKPDLCQRCFNGPAYDLANVTGVYNRDLTNWKYLCRRCHMWYDGRLSARDKKGRWASPKQMKVYSPLLSQYKKHLRRSHSRSGEMK